MKKSISIIILLLIPAMIHSRGLDCDNEPELEYTQFRVLKNLLYMNGTINSDTPSKLKRILDQNHQIRVVIMECVPGSADDDANLKAARLIRNRKLHTHIADKGMVASGGTDFFLAGVKRTIGDDVYIGVHSWSSGDGQQDTQNFPKNSQEHQRYILYYQEMGIPIAFYWFTLQAAPADGMHNMTDEELERYSILTHE